MWHYDILAKDSLELSKVLVSNQGSKDGREIAEEWEGMVDDGGVIVVEVKLWREVDDKNGWKWHKQLIHGAKCSTLI